MRSNIELFHNLIEEMDLPLIKLVGKEPDEGNTWLGKGNRSYEEIGLNEDCNAGVVTGEPSGVIVLDVDDAELFPEEYTITDTFTVESSPNKNHYYFFLPAGENHSQYMNRSFKRCGFDIRATGGYVVAPGSIHPDTDSEYKIINDGEIKFAA